MWWNKFIIRSAQNSCTGNLHPFWNLSIKYVDLWPNPLEIWILSEFLKIFPLFQRHFFKFSPASCSLCPRSNCEISVSLPPWLAEKVSVYDTESCLFRRNQISKWNSDMGLWWSLNECWKKYHILKFGGKNSNITSSL